MTTRKQRNPKKHSRKKRNVSDAIRSSDPTFLANAKINARRTEKAIGKMVHEGHTAQTNKKLAAMMDRLWGTSMICRVEEYHGNKK